VALQGKLVDVFVLEVGAARILNSDRGGTREKLKALPVTSTSPYFKAIIIPFLLMQVESIRILYVPQNVNKLFFYCL